MVGRGVWICLVNISWWKWMESKLYGGSEGSWKIKFPHFEKQGGSDAQHWDCRVGGGGGGGCLSCLLGGIIDKVSSSEDGLSSRHRLVCWHLELFTMAHSDTATTKKRKTKSYDPTESSKFVSKTWQCKTVKTIPFKKWRREDDTINIFLWELQHQHG